MDILNSDPSRIVVKQHWFTLHGIALGAVVTSASLLIATPFFARDLSNQWHRFFRWSALGFGLVGGATGISCSVALEKLRPQIVALEKQELAQTKHSIASTLWIAQQVNTLIAQSVVSARKAELTGTYPAELTDLPEAEVSNFPTSVSSVSSVSPIQEWEIDNVTDALEDGRSDTWIIERILRMGGRHYERGKERLEKIKSSLAQNDEE